MPLGAHSLPIFVERKKKREREKKEKGKEGGKEEGRKRRRKEERKQPTVISNYSFSTKL